MIVVLPGETPTARPAVPAELLMVATDDFEDVQVTELVMSCVLPSAKPAIAVYCAPTCTGMFETGVLTVMVCNAEDSTTTAEVLETEPSCA